MTYSEYKKNKNIEADTKSASSSMTYAEYKAKKNTQTDVTRTGSVKTSFIDTDTPTTSTSSEKKNYLNTYEDTTSAMDTWGYLSPERKAESNQIRQYERAKKAQATEDALTKYAELSKDPEYATLSAYKPTSTGTKEYFYNAGDSSQMASFTDNDYSDLTYELVNKNKNAREIQNMMDFGQRESTGNITNGLTETSYLDYLDDEQTGIYNYLYNKQGKDAANEYLETVKPLLNEQMTQAVTDEAKAYAEANPGKATWESVLTSPRKALTYIEQAKDFITDGDIDENAYYNAIVNRNAELRNVVSEKKSEKWKDAALALGMDEESADRYGALGSWLYQTKLSVADNVMNMALTGFGALGAAGEFATLAMMSGGAAADSIVQAKQEGMDDDQAFMIGTIAGAIEYVTEKMGYDAFFDKKLLADKGTIRYLASNILAEGSEEGTSNIANLIVGILEDSVTEDRFSEFAKTYDSYMAENPTASTSDAVIHTVLSLGWDLIKDVAGGMLSGGVMSGSGVVSNAIGNTISGHKLNSEIPSTDSSEVYRAYINQGLELNKDSQAYTQAEKASKQFAETGKISDYRLGTLAQSIDARNSIEAQTADELIEKGRTNLTDDVVSEISQNLVALDRLGIEVEDGEPTTSIQNKVRNTLANESNKTLAEAQANTQTEEKSSQTDDFKIKDVVRDVQGFKEAQSLTEQMDAVVDTLGEEGKTAFNSIAQGSARVLKYAEAQKAFKAGLNGEAFKASGNVLSSEEQRTMWYAGVKQAQSYTKSNNVVMREGGYFKNEYTGRITENAQKVLDGLGKGLGTQIRIGKSSDTYNATYRDGYIEIAANAYHGRLFNGTLTDEDIRDIVAHELTHRMQELSPKAYEDYKKSVIKYLKQEGTYQERYTKEAALERRNFGKVQDVNGIEDELVSDFAGELLENEDVFVNFAKDNRTIAEKFLDFIKSIADSIKEKLGKDISISAIERKYRRLLNESVKVVSSSEITNTDELSIEDSVEKFSLKGIDADGRFVYESDFPASMPFEEREKIFKNSLIEILNNGNIELDTDKKHIKVKADKFTRKKNINGDLGRGSDDPVFRSEYEAKVNALYDLVDIIQTSTFVPPANPEPSYQTNVKPKNKAHKGVHEWYKFSNNIVFDGYGYNVEINIRNKGGENYEYLITFKKDGTSVNRTAINSLLPYTDMPSEERLSWLKQNVKYAELIKNKNFTAAQTLYDEMLNESQTRKSVKEVFSAKSPVEETKNLIALHNLTEDNLINAMDLGGFAMPSIAVVKSDTGHDQYGPISVVFPKDAIDPKKNKNNKLYGADAWTPVMPEINYKADRKVADKIHDEIANLVGENVKRALGYPDLTQSGISERLDRNNGNVVEAYRDNYTMMYAFLKDTGKEVTLPGKTETYDNVGHFNNELVESVAKAFTPAKVDQLLMSSQNVNETIINKLRNEANKYKEAELRKKYKSNNADKIIKTLLYNEENFGFAQADSLLHAMRKSYKGTQTVIDKYESYGVIRNAVNQEEYAKWLKEKFDGIIEKKGLYNGKDIFTPSGNRRSWDSLHNELTLNSVVKAMKQKDSKGGSSIFGGVNLEAVASKDYKSIAEMKKDSGRLKKLTPEDFENSKKAIIERINEITDKIMSKKHDNYFIAYDNAAEAIGEAIRRSRTPEGIQRYLDSRSAWLNPYDGVGEEIAAIVNEMAQIPTKYFEAKPERAVQFSEALAYVIPDNSSDTLKTRLSDMGLNVIEYKNGDEADRLARVNSVEGARFSAKDTNGNSLSKGQIEYFSKSKARDTNGNLLVVYHGSNQVFNVFNSESNKYGSNNVNFYTTNRDVADSYGKVQYMGYANAVSPYILEGNTNGTTLEYSTTGKKELSQNKEIINSISKKLNANGSRYWKKSVSNIVNKILENKNNILTTSEVNYLIEHPFSLAYLSAMAKDGFVPYSKSVMTNDVVNAVLGINAIGGKYDSVIFKSIEDSGRVNTDKSFERSDVIALFDSNQFKNIDNLNPTKDKDIRYSAKVDDGEQLSIFDMMDEKEKSGRDLYLETLETTLSNIKDNHFSSRYFAELYKQHPELDYVERLHNKEWSAETDLAAFLSTINDTKTVDNISWYSSQTHYINKSGYRSAVKKFRDYCSARMQAIAIQEGKNTVLNLKEGRMSIQELRNLFDKLNSNDEIKQLADKVFKVSEELGVVIHFNNQLMGRPKYNGIASGRYAQYKLNYFNDVSMGDQNKASTILHELIHNCTAYAIDLVESGETWDLTPEMTQAVKTLKSVYKQVKADPELSKMYGSKDVYEMVAELSNVKFREAMQKKSLLQKVFDAIKGFFGIKSDSSLFDAVDNVLDFMLDEASYHAENFNEFSDRAKRWLDRKGYKYSAKGTENIATLAQQNVELQSKIDEINKLKRELKASEKSRMWWANQLKKTEVITARTEDVKKLCKAIVKAYDSRYLPEDLNFRMQSLANMFIKDDTDMGKAKALAMDMAQDVIQNSFVLEGDPDTEKSILSYLKSTRINVPQDVRRNIGDYNAWRNKYFGKMKLGTEGMDIDQVWQELQGIYGTGLFPDSYDSTAELLYLAELTDNLGKNYIPAYSDYEMADATEFLANEIISRVSSDEIRRVAPTYADKLEAKYAEKEKSYRKKITKLQDVNYRLTKAIAEQIGWTEAEWVGNGESAERKELLKLAQRLSKVKTTQVNRAWINEFIGNLDTVAMSITGKKMSELKELSEWIEERKESDPDFIPDPNMEKAVSRLKKVRIADLNIDEVREMIDILKWIEHEIRYEKKLVDQKERRDIYELGKESIDDIRNAKGNKNGVINWVETETLSPVRQMHRYTGYKEDSPLYKLTLALADGQREMFDFQRRANETFRKFTEDTQFMKEIQGEHAKEIEIQGLTANGVQTVKITPAMRISLYLHSRNYQNMLHISTGGVTIPNMKLYKKGNIAEAYNEGTVIQLQKSEIDKICQGMTAKERALAREIEYYFNTTSQKAINDTSEKLKGYSLAQVEHYFPINTDSNFTQREFESIKMDGTIEGMGFLKERINGKNAILLRDANSVLDQSIRMTAKYVGLAIPVRNFGKVWNVGTRTYTEDQNVLTNDSVKQAMGVVWGNPGKNYVEKMMKDVNGVSASDRTTLDRVLNKIRSNYAGAVLTLNASVALKQAASYPSAGSVIGMKPLLQALNDRSKVDENLIAKYTPLFWYRSQGYSTQELGDLTSIDKRLPKTLNWIQGIDLATTKKLWKAAEYYVRENSKVEVGTDKYYREVADIYNRIIEETQPNYTTMQRPQILRSESSLQQSLMMFKTQPFQNFNILYDAFGVYNAKMADLKNGIKGAETEVKKAKTDLVNAIVSQTAATLTFVGMTLAWAALRGRMDPYEDEEGNLSAVALLETILNNMVGMIPFGTEAYEAASALIKSLIGAEYTYYGPEEITSAQITDIVEALTSITDMANKEDLTTNTIMVKTLKAANTLSKAISINGNPIPLENIVNIVSIFYTNGAKLISGEYVGQYQSLTWRYDPSTYPAPFYDVLYEAYKNDREQYKTIRKMLIKKGLKSDNIQNAIRNRAKEDK